MASEIPSNRRWLRPLQFGLTLIALSIYLAYVWQVSHSDRGPVDYDTFMQLGHRLLSGQEVYIENSYYPLPTVMGFALFSLLPRWLSVSIWTLSVAVGGLIISAGQPWVLLFGPVFAHFLGGQTAVLPMLGLWGYRKAQDVRQFRGGIWLALTLFKPQLAVVPVVWASVIWFRDWRQNRVLPRQFWAWLVTALIIYLPSFLVMPDWPLRWLRQPRPLFERALSGFVPRSLVILGTPDWLFWPALIVIASGLLVLIVRTARNKLTLDLAVLWNFVVSPLVHDYDLIQIVSLLEKPALQWSAVLLSVPMWFVILFAYGNDKAWAVVTIIAPALLFLKLLLDRRTVTLTPNAEEN